MWDALIRTVRRMLRCTAISECGACRDGALRQQIQRLGPRLLGLGCSRYEPSATLLGLFCSIEKAISAQAVKLAVSAYNVGRYVHVPDRTGKATVTRTEEQCVRNSRSYRNELHVYTGHFNPLFVVDDSWRVVLPYR